MMLRPLSVVFCVGVLVVPVADAAPRKRSPAAEPAKPPPPEPNDDDLRAKKLFEDGTRAFNLGEFQTAVSLYRQAYKIKPEPGLVYNIAQAYRLSNDPGNAVFFYRSFLRLAPNTPNRKEIEERIRKLEAQIAEQKAPPNSAVGLGALPPPTEGDGDGEKRPVATSPAPAPAATAVVAPRSEPPPPKRKTGLYIGIAVGAVVVVGVGLGVGLGLGLPPSAPSSHFGTRPVF